MTAVSFTVLGTPIPQGSKTKTRWGGLREDNPATQPWRDTVAWQARATMGSTPPLLGPCALRVVFYLPRPKAHYGTGKNADRLKATAPGYCQTKPDLDKLLRAIGDALTTAGVWRDDNQAVTVDASKLYAFPGQQPGCHITVTPLPEGDTHP